MLVDSAWLPVAHVVATLVMVGIIWFVQGAVGRRPGLSGAIIGV